jgi:VanZ family protein
MVLAGGAVEIVQSFVGREAELADWVAEIVAVVAAAGVLGVLRYTAGAAGSSRGESSTG